MPPEENLVSLEKVALEGARRLLRAADAREREVVEIRAAAAAVVRNAARLTDEERAVQLAEACRLLDAADTLEQTATDLRKDATVRVRQASRLTGERQSSAPRSGGHYAGEMRVADGTILPCGDFVFDDA
jgi:hypothetical protein